MYDRKKITLFVLLIATVILGGVSLFLATQINNNQSPDDSQAGNGACTAKNAANSEICQAKGEASCKADSLCNWTPAACGGEGQACCGNNPATCSGNLVCGSGDTCEQVVAPACGGEGQACCGNNPATCTGNLTCNNDLCVAPAVVCDTTQSCPAGSSRITLEGANLCKCLCNSGTVVNPGGSCSTGGTGGTASCAQNGEIISHGNTACINGTNYTCNNGTATPGSSCSTEPGTTTGGSTGGSTGSTCTPSNPQKAKFIGPGRDAVLNTATVTLQWQRNGTFGVACPTNDNKYRVRLLAIGLNETCPTSSLDIPNLPGQIEPGTSDEGTFNYQINVQDDTKYCWAIRKNNGDTVADTAVRSFTVDLQETNPTTGTTGGDETGTTTSAPIDETTTGGNNATSTTGGTVAGSIAGDNTSLPETAIVSDELDPIILGMILVIIGLTLYKFDFGRKNEVE